MSSRRLRPALALLVGVAWACGGDNVEAPKPPPAPQTCKSFDQLMPALTQIIAMNQTQNLKTVVETYLVLPQGQEQTSAAADVLRAVFQTLSTFAAYPPE